MTYDAADFISLLRECQLEGISGGWSEDSPLSERVIAAIENYSQLQLALDREKESHRASRAMYWNLHRIASDEKSKYLEVARLAEKRLDEAHIHAMEDQDQYSAELCELIKKLEIANSRIEKLLAAIHVTDLGQLQTCKKCERGWYASYGCAEIDMTCPFCARDGRVESKINREWLAKMADQNNAKNDLNDLPFHAGKPAINEKLTKIAKEAAIIEKDRSAPLTGKPNTEFRSIDAEFIKKASEASIKCEDDVPTTGGKSLPKMTGEWLIKKAIEILGPDYEEPDFSSMGRPPKSKPNK